MYARSGTILVAGLLILSCTLVPVPASAQDAATAGHTIIDLGTLGGASSVARDLNDLGQIVGNSDTASSQQHAFAWENGVMTGLVTDGIDATASSAAAINASGQAAGYIDVLTDRSPVLWDKGIVTHLPTGTGYNCAVHAINSVGQAVGSCYCVGPAYLRSCAVKWDSGVLTNFGAGSSASAINNRGQVVGTRYTGSGSYHASLWENGVVTDLGTSGEGHSIGVDINERGQVVGYSGHAFLWDNGVRADLGTLGGVYSRATAINERGQVVGYSTTAAGEEHAFLWENGVITDLGTLGGDYSQATAINERGQVVGNSATTSGEEHAFLWENGVLSDLGTLGGAYSQAVAINERGQVAGNSETAAGHGHAVLWETNFPPVCTGATPIPASLWPANHKFVPINVHGVTDRDNATVTITVDRIFQDEAANAPGSGGTSPDGTGVGEPVAQVRAERMGAGDGRVYHIGFTATDEHGATCSGEVTVGVPKSRSQWQPVDGGALYDSMAVFAGASSADLPADEEQFEEIFLPLVQP